MKFKQIRKSPSLTMPSRLVQSAREVLELNVNGMIFSIPGSKSHTAFWDGSQATCTEALSLDEIAHSAGSLCNCCSADPELSVMPRIEPGRLFVLIVWRMFIHVALRDQLCIF